MTIPFSRTRKEKLKKQYFFKVLLPLFLPAMQEDVIAGYRLIHTELQVYEIRRDVENDSYSGKYIHILKFENNLRTRSGRGPTTMSMNTFQVET